MVYILFNGNYNNAVDGVPIIHTAFGPYSEITPNWLSFGTMYTEGYAKFWFCPKCRWGWLRLNFNLTRLFCGDGGREIQTVQCMNCGWWNWY